MITLKKHLHLFKEFSWVSLGQISTALLSLVGIRIITELIDSKFLGEATLWLGIIILLKNIFIAPIGLTQARYHPEYLNNNQIEWFGTKILLLLKKSYLITVVIFMAFILVFDLLTARKFEYLLIILLCIYLMFDTIKNYKLNQVTAERMQDFVAKWTISETIFLYSSLFLLLKITPNTFGYILAQTFGLALGVLIFGYVMFPIHHRHDASIKIDSEVIFIKRIRQYGLPFIPLAVLGWISNLGDRYLIETMLSSNYVGIYAAAYGLASRPFIMFSGIIAGFFKSILFQAESTNQKEKAKKIFRYWILIVAAIGLIGLIGFSLIGDLVSKIFLAANYRMNSTEIFIWVGLGYSLFNLTQTVENRLLSYGYSKKIVLPAAIGAISNIIFNIILIPQFGIVGAAQSTAFCFLIQLIIISVILYKHVSS